MGMGRVQLAVEGLTSEVTTGSVGGEMLRVGSGGKVGCIDPKYGGIAVPWTSKFLPVHVGYGGGANCRLC